MAQSRRSCASHSLPVPRDLAVRFVSSGGEHLAILSFSARGGADLPASLSDAERAVIELLIEGLSYKQIGERRKRSARTVANQIASAFRKLGVRSRSELVARYSG